MPALVDLRNLLSEHFLLTEPATVEQTLAMLRESWTYVVELDDRLVGAFALYGRDGDTMQFGRFMLEWPLRGKGYGRRMLQFAITSARAMGVERLQLVTKPLNGAACELYEEAGFEVTQVRMELNLD